MRIMLSELDLDATLHNEEAIPMLTGRPNMFINGKIDHFRSDTLAYIEKTKG